MLRLFLTLFWISSNYYTFLKFSEKQVQNFNKFFIKFTQILFIIYSIFLTIFSKIFEYSSNFFQNFKKYYSKQIFFLIFTVFSRQFLNLLLIFYQVFCKFLKFFFKDLLSLDKITVEIRPNFRSGLHFLTSFRNVFNFFWLSNFFSQKINLH